MYRKEEIDALRAKFMFIMKKLMLERTILMSKSRK